MVEGLDRVKRALETFELPITLRFVVLTELYRAECDDPVVQSERLNDVGSNAPEWNGGHAQRLRD